MIGTHDFPDISQMLIIRFIKRDAVMSIAHVVLGSSMGCGSKKILNSKLFEDEIMILKVNLLLCVDFFVRC